MHQLNISSYLFLPYAVLACIKAEDNVLLLNLDRAAGGAGRDPVAQGGLAMALARSARRLWIRQAINDFNWRDFAIARYKVPAENN